jgi:hypothetical protein
MRADRFCLALSYPPWKFLRAGSFSSSLPTGTRKYIDFFEFFVYLLRLNLNFKALPYENRTEDIPKFLDLPRAQVHPRERYHPPRGLPTARPLRGGGAPCFYQKKEKENLEGNHLSNPGAPRTMRAIRGGRFRGELSLL